MKPPPRRTPEYSRRRFKVSWRRRPNKPSPTQMKPTSQEKLAPSRGESERRARYSWCRAKKKSSLAPKNIGEFPILEASHRLSLELMQSFEMEAIIWVSLKVSKFMQDRYSGQERHRRYTYMKNVP